MWTWVVEEIWIHGNGPRSTHCTVAFILYSDSPLELSGHRNFFVRFLFVDRQKSSFSLVVWPLTSPPLYVVGPLVEALFLAASLSTVL